jgi:hypothetical protein
MTGRKLVSRSTAYETNRAENAPLYALQLIYSLHSSSAAKEWQGTGIHSAQ